MKKIKHIHIIGIGGISLSAIAKLLLHFNVSVSGSDTNESDLTHELEDMNVKITYEHKAENVHGADVVIFSAAIRDDNPEIIEAKKLKIKLLTRAQMLGKITKGFKNVISVAGSHGKTTTTGMIASCFIDAGLDPTVHIGGELKKIGGNSRIGGKKFFITEACEYKDSFLEIKSDVAVTLNIQPDHMDYFKTFDNLQKSFQKYLKNTKMFGINIVNADDLTTSKFVLKKRFISYGIYKNADVMARNIRKNKYAKYSFDLFLLGRKYDRFMLSIPGKHQIYNALACICVCIKYKLDLRLVKKSLSSYSGIKRRWEEIGEINNALVVHDYAHHPTEIQANIIAGKSYTKGKVIVVFQPHTYSRTKELFDDFVNSLMFADLVYLYKIYPAREEPIDGVTSDALSEKINQVKPSKSFDNFEDIINELKTVSKKDDLILILGAGDIEQICKFLVNN